MRLLAPQPEGIPAPRRTAITARFWDGCVQGELRYQRCDKCGYAIFDPTAQCRYCGSTMLSWQVSKGTGHVYSWSVVWRPPSTKFEVPYAAVIVELDEGFHMISNVVDCQVDELRVGLEVEVCFRPIGPDVVLPYFRPRSSPRNRGPQPA